MLDSIIRGLKMIWASIKMGWQDKRLLIPSVLTVYTNCFFGCIFLLDGLKQMGHQAQGATRHISSHHPSPTYGYLNQEPSAGGIGSMINLTQINGPADPNGMGSLNWHSASSFFTTDNIIILASLMMIWWLTNRILEGITTALVYSHLTEGKGTGKFSNALQAVLQSLPAIIVLGFVTLIVKKIAGFLRNKNHSGIFGAGFNILASLVEVFWTLAGHLILPAIVIEGSSFWGALKRADKIAQSSLLTIGVGEVGVELICRLGTALVYLGGVTTFGAALYTKINMLSVPFILVCLAWLAILVLVTALSIYIRSAFYTCLYVWAIEAEAVEESERINIKAPGPLAAALA